VPIPAVTSDRFAADSSTISSFRFRSAMATVIQEPKVPGCRTESLSTARAHLNRRVSLRLNL
jgi:hypothetical protein